MINILEEVATTYNDSWRLTFYFILVLAVFIALFWTYIQVVVKPLKKIILKENIIYNHPEDVIEQFDLEEEMIPKKKDKK